MSSLVIVSPALSPDELSAKAVDRATSFVFSDRLSNIFKLVGVVESRRIGLGAFGMGHNF